MRFYIRHPTEALIRQYGEKHAKLGFTYSQVGLTKDYVCPAGFQVNHARSTLGIGQECFLNSVEAIRCFRMLDLGWLQCSPPEREVKEEMTVCTVMRMFGVYTVAATRVVYVEDRGSKFGFAYGTLPGHIVSGEERFTTTIDVSSGEVCFEVFSFSKAASMAHRLLWPLISRTQKRFCKQSIDVMRSQSSGGCSPLTFNYPRQ